MKQPKNYLAAIITLICSLSVGFIGPIDPLGEPVATKCFWVGRVEATKNIFGHIETITGTLKFEHEDTYGSSVVYKLVGGNLTWSASGTFGGGTVSGGPFNFSISADSGDVGQIEIDSSGNYVGTATFAKLTDGTKRVTIIGSGISVSVTPLLMEMIIGEDDSTFVQNDQLKGTYTLKVAADYFSTYKWDLHKESGEEVQLVVESEGYDQWMPEAGKSENEVGSILNFLAKLTEPDGSPACARADSFKFELKNVSNEPGVALNFPNATSAQKDYDLHFLAEFNSSSDVMSADRLALRTEGGLTASAVVPCFDWGAYGELKVTAFLQGGKTVVGRLKGQPSAGEIPIPKRNSGSKIADKWKKDRNVEGQGDGDDNENEPAGDGDAGDGFTLYEEYRGFYENGDHVLGDPARKDLFVYTTLDEFIPGILLFKAITGLNVHCRLTAEEFDPRKRVMNFNHLNAPHQSFDQHGLVLQKTDASFCFVDELGPPKNVDSVNIAGSVLAAPFRTAFLGGRMEINNFLNSTVAHELGHAVRINHHGEADVTRTWSFRATSSGDLELVENVGTPIDFRAEDNTPVPLPATANVSVRFYVNLGVWGGEHSGFDDCVMRYDVAFAYIPGPGTASNIRYVTYQRERTGMTLCTTKEDGPNGVNYLHRRPRSRYGSAVNGECKRHICVNDKYH